MAVQWPADRTTCKTRTCPYLLLLWLSGLKRGQRQRLEDRPVVAAAAPRPENRTICCCSGQDCLSFHRTLTRPMAIPHVWQGFVGSCSIICSAKAFFFSSASGRLCWRSFFKPSNLKCLVRNLLELRLHIVTLQGPARPRRSPRRTSHSCLFLDFRLGSRPRPPTPSPTRLAFATPGSPNPPWSSPWPTYMPPCSCKYMLRLLRSRLAAGYPCQVLSLRLGLRYPSSMLLDAMEGRRGLATDWSGRRCFVVLWPLPF